MTIRALVIVTRFQLGMTQEELGAAIGYSGSQVSEVERGRREATLDFLAAPARVAARENTPPDHMPPDGLLRAKCAECPIGQAYDDIAATTKRRAA